MRTANARHTKDFSSILAWLGGADRLEAEARETGAYQRAREVKCAVDMLRIVLAYCLGPDGLRLTAAWAEAMGLASISNVAVLKRVRRSVPWLEALVARMLVATAPPLPPRVRALTGARPIRLVDATVVTKADRASREAGGVWRVHCVWNLVDERFSAFELTDEKEGEHFDRAVVIAGEIRIGDRAYLQPERIATVMAAGGDVIVRAPWNGARWVDAKGVGVDLVALLATAKKTVTIIDRPIWMATAGGRVAVRLVALRKPHEAVGKSLKKVIAEATRRGTTPQPGTIFAAEWLILVTSLAKAEYPATAIGDLYRLRWRIEIAFKHLKSGVGLCPPPGPDPDVAKAHILSHLLIGLLTEPLVREQLGDSPRLAAA